MRTNLQPGTWVLKRVSNVCRRCYSNPAPTARLRFAPSPTGFLHLGGLRMALLNHIMARKLGGKWILRVEDTDQTRLVPGSVDALRRDLEWAGLDYDEGVGRGGSKGPYTQSERLDLYHHHIKTLLSNGSAYECFCTPTESEAIARSLKQSGTRRSYDGRCRHLTDEDVARRKKAGQKHVVRFKAPGTYPRMPPDLVFGEHTTPTDIPDQMMEDFVLLKSDGYPTYHLASVVDDYEMGISHVIRGEEWLPSLPKHYQLYESFGWTPPSFAHIPVLVREDGTKLSKRSGDAHVGYYREKGYEPDALVNFLALIGWDYHTALESLNSPHSFNSSPSSSSSSSSSSSPPSLSSSAPSSSELVLPPHIRRDHHSLYEIFTLPQIIASFDLNHLTHRRSAVNMDKLNFLNKTTIRRKAGRLGKDGVMVSKGKEVLGIVRNHHGREGVESVHEDQEGVLSARTEGEVLGRVRGDDGMEVSGIVGNHEGREREDVIRRYQDCLREQKVLNGCELVEDFAYVEKVFDAELPRTTLIPEMASGSIFFYLEPTYTSAEAQSLLSTLDRRSYLRNIETILPILEAELPTVKTSDHRGEKSSDEIDPFEDVVYNAAKEVTGKLRLKGKSEVMKVLRHALTGRKEGPRVPTTMSVLGVEQNLKRLRNGLEFVRRLEKGV